MKTMIAVAVMMMTAATAIAGERNTTFKTVDS